MRKKDMRIILMTFFLVAVSFSVFSQEEKYPVYEGCELLSEEDLKQCFKEKITAFVISKLILPDEVKKDSIKNRLNIVFFVTKEGEFEVLYVNSPYKELKVEVERVFTELPKVIPAKYNNHNIEMQFVLPIDIPLNSNQGKKIAVKKYPVEEELELFNVDSLQLLEHHSQLNMPYTRQEYNVLDFYFNKGANSHTAVKPYLYSEIQNYIDLDAKKAINLGHTLLIKWVANQCN